MIQNSINSTKPKFINSKRERKRDKTNRDDTKVRDFELVCVRERKEERNGSEYLREMLYIVTNKILMAEALSHCQSLGGNLIQLFLPFQKLALARNGRKYLGDMLYNITNRILLNEAVTLSLSSSPITWREFVPSFSSFKK